MADLIQRSPLQELLRLCTVKLLDENGQFCGTGFFVTPQKLVTCFHVLFPGNKPLSRFYIEGIQKPFLLQGKSKYHSGLDLLIIDLGIHISEYCVNLAYQTSQTGNQLWGWSFNKNYPTGVGLVPILQEAAIHQKFQVLRIKRDAIVTGSSGTPILNLATGRILGTTYWVKNSDDALIVPAKYFEEYFSEIYVENQEHHNTNFYWEDARQHSKNPTDRYGTDILYNDENSPPKIQIYSLPTLQPYFTGRKNVLDILDASWSDQSTNILQLIAPGGIGKTSLITQWLQNYLPKSSEKNSADVIFVWSFHSQGTDDRKQNSSDLFFQQAMAFLGQRKMPLDLWERGRILANLVRRYRCLLILDGVEPLQYPTGPLQGELKDPALRVLIKELAFEQPGLCILTTRLSVAELEGFTYPAHRKHKLEPLSPEEGLQLLRIIGVTGTDDDLNATVVEYKGHALALRLLSNYLVELFNGDLRQRDRIPHLIDDEHTGSQVRRMMDAYVNWFEDSYYHDNMLSNRLENSIQSPEVALLNLLGLFNHPVPIEVLDILFAKPYILGLTESLYKLDSNQLKKTIRNLEKLGLLSKTIRTDSGLPKELNQLIALNYIESLDAHPMVREYFGHRLESTNIVAWREANNRLYNYYRHLPIQDLPDTIEDMEPLFLSIAHGCKAGKQMEALEEVYWERIRRKEVNYSIKNLGLFGLELTAIAHAFDQVWDTPSQNLTEFWQAGLLSLAGFRLRGLGRLQESVELLSQSIKRFVKMKKWQNASADATNSSELYLLLGLFTRAVEYGQLAVKYADQSEDGLTKESSRASLATVFHQMNNQIDSEVLFKEVESLQQKRLPEYRFLKSIMGYLYCELLIDQGRIDEVLERATEGLKIAIKNSWLLDISLYHLSIGCAYAKIALKTSKNIHDTSVEEYFNLAIEGFHKAGMGEFLTKGLIDRATWHRHSAHFEQAEKDLKEAFEIARSSNMRLYLVDYHIEMSRLYIIENNPEKASQHKAEASRLLQMLGYWRRLADLSTI